MRRHTPPSTPSSDYTQADRNLISRFEKLQKAKLSRHENLLESFGLEDDSVLRAMVCYEIHRVWKKLPRRYREEILS